MDVPDYGQAWSTIQGMTNDARHLVIEHESIVNRTERGALADELKRTIAMLQLLADTYNVMVDWDKQF